MACAWLAVVSLAFAELVTALATHALSQELHSHILLVPFVTAHLLWHRRPLPFGERSWGGALAAGSLGVAALAGALIRSGSLSLNDDVALQTFAYLSFLFAGGFLFLGSRWMKAAAFPLGFLAFMIPLPDAAVNWLENASMLASAEAAAVFFNLAPTPVLRDGTIFELPGIVLRVAQECSGIRSSWVLFITSVLASNLFLKGTWRRIALVLFVIPLGVIRNGFRVFVIGMLCVHVGPHMIHSPIHHRGGPVFFVLSLIPLFLFLWWLRRGERATGAPAAAGTPIESAPAVPVP